MKPHAQLLNGPRALAAPLALLTGLLLWAAPVAAQHGSHGGSHHGGGHHGSSHGSSGHRGGGHSSSGHHGSSHHSSSHHSTGHHHRGHVSFYSHRYGYPFYPWYGSPYYRGYGERSRSGFVDGGAMGALDLDIRPETAAVYLDGEYIGQADDFDGYPSYLWLPRGEVELVFYLDGYQTLARRYAVGSGRVRDVTEALVPGTSSSPEERPASATKHRPTQGESRPQAPVSDLRREAGRLTLEVVPADAAVYLDGRFVGVGGDLAEALLLDPGSHVVEVVRPDHPAVTWSFELAPGGELEHRIELARP